MKRLLTMVLCLALVCLGGCGKSESYSGPEDGVMSINGETVSQDEFCYYLIMAAFDIAKEQGVVYDDRSEFWDGIDGETGKTYRQMAFEKATEECKVFHVYRTEAEAQGITLSDEDKEKIDTNANGIVRSYGEKMYELQMKAGGLTTQVHRDITEMGYYSTLLHNKFFNDFEEISKEEIESYFRENYRTVKHILVMTYDPESQLSATDEEKAEALAKIQEAFGKIQEGEDFDALMEEYNQDTGAESYPKGYTLSMEDDYVEVFKETAFLLEEGQISGIVESEYGYHILKRFPLNESELENKETDVMSAIIDEAFEKQLEEYNSRAVVLINEDVYNALDVEEVLSGYLEGYDSVLMEIQQEFMRLDESEE